MESIIKLTYGDGFTGRQYNIEINGGWVNLLSNTVGGYRDEQIAKEIARNILIQKFGNDCGIDQMEFEWDGTM